MLNAKYSTMLFGIFFLGASITGSITDLMAAENTTIFPNHNHQLMHFLTGILFLAGGSYGYARPTIIALGVTYLFMATLGFMNFNAANLADPGYVNILDRLFNTLTAAVILTIGLLSSSDNQPA